MKEKLLLARRVFELYAFIFVVWGCYRFLFRLPEEVEEIVLKPIIWLGPTIYFVYKEKEKLASIGWSTKNLFKSLYLGIGLGLIFALEGLATHAVKYQGFQFIKLPYPTISVFLAALALSFVTAVSEETTFRGYIFNRLWQVLRNEWAANGIVSVLFSLIHLPMTIFVLHYNPIQLLIYLFLVFLSSLGSGFLFARTGTIVASILLHVFWSWPIILFR